ncbi:DUF2867 domain-containing protein [Catenulispora subtropica]
MRLASTAHTTQPWLIHEIAPDFRLEDVWALPTPGGPDGFPTLVAVLQGSDFERDAPPAARLLWRLRWKLGSLLGLDRSRDGLGDRVASLRDRLPADLQEAARTHHEEGRLPFTFLYERDNERAGEIANRTMHGVMHLSWVPDGEGGWRGQMAILVKPNGRLGTLYMAAIKPFRYLIVYPAMLRSWERRWEHQWEHATTKP